MNKQQLFQTLADAPPATLLDLLAQAYDEMSVEQRQRVFGQYVPPKPPPQPVDGEALLRQIEAFRDASLAGYYYASFAVNSENWMDIFAEEAGSWMIPGDEKEYIAAYLTALAATTDPEVFTAAAIPLIERDSGHSLTAQVYPSAIRVANKAQQAHLEAEVRRQNIRTEQWW